MLTSRGGVLALAAIAAVLVAAFSLNLILIVLAVFVVAFLGAELLLFAAAARTIALSWFTVRRDAGPTRVASGGLARASVRIEHAGRVAFRAKVADVVPDLFDVVDGAAAVEGWWPADGALELAYVFRPRARGIYTLGPTVLLAQDALGLAYRRIEIGTPTEVRVSPASPQVTLRRSTLKLAVRPIGGVPVSRRGYGTEFRALRPYLHGDDYRAIAWRRSQQGRLYVREFEQESRQDFLLVISLAQEMNAGRVGETALDRACEAGMLLAQYVPRGGDQFGLLLLDPSLGQFLPPSRGTLHSLKITEALTTAGASPESPDLATLLRALSVRLRRPTHVFVFAPLPEAIGTTMAAFAQFRAAGHRLYLFPPDVAGLYPPFPELARHALFEFTATFERAREARLAGTMQSVGIPVYRFDRTGAAPRLLALYQQIHNWGVGY